MYYSYETGRLYLRILSSDYTEQVLDFYYKNKEEFERLEPSRSERFYTPEYQKISMEVEYKKALEGDLYRFWIFEKTNPDRIIGTVSIRNIQKAPYSRCEIGYKLGKEYRGRGFASEAVEALCQVIFNDIGLHRIEAACLPENLPSIKLLSGLGFEKEGYLKEYIEIDGKYKDHLLYARTKP